MPHVRAGDQVSIHYTARYADGSVFASTHTSEFVDQELSFEAGSAEVIEGISSAVIGMHSGEKKVLSVAPEKGFGARDEELARRVPRADLPGDVRLGDQFQAEAGERTLSVWVRELDGESALLDANHPLAGHHLIIELELVSFRSTLGSQ